MALAIELTYFSNSIEPLMERRGTDEFFLALQLNQA
jgi:hypothetical protein